jgi:hypothetical protein
VSTLSLTVLGCHVKVQCQDAETQALLVANYGHMQGQLEAVDLRYAVGRAQGSAAFFIRRAGQEPQVAADAGKFLLLFEQDMTIELQKLRRDLYFVHSAVLEWGGKACMLVAASGSGKSTMTWALAHHGFRYLSDELGPIDLTTWKVCPYPHALCLKAEAPPPYPLPAKTVYTSRALYIPVGELPGGVSRCSIPLAAICFLRHCPEAYGPAMRPISKAEAGVRLFANALNPLAHPGDGLDGAIAIATRSACFALDTVALPETCALVIATLQGLFCGAQKQRASRRGMVMPQRGQR